MGLSTKRADPNEDFLSDRRRFRALDGDHVVVVVEDPAGVDFRTALQCACDLAGWDLFDHRAAGRELVPAGPEVDNLRQAIAQQTMDA